MPKIEVSHILPHFFFKILTFSAMGSKREDEIMKGFGRHLKELRERKSLSLRQLEAITGLDHSFIGKMENAGANPSLVTLFLLADGLGVDVTELVNFSMKDS
jgi:ribosome-binding protein aMBF1 (putative translation factor)